MKMRLILKNRLYGITALTIYLNAIFEFILPTNGNVRKASFGDFKQHHKQGRRLEHLLPPGTFFSNKARSSISFDESYAKEQYTYEHENIQGKLINGLAPFEYLMDNEKQSRSLIKNITKVLKEPIDQDSFDWKIRHVQRKLRFGVTSNKGAHGNDLSFTDSNQGLLKHSASVDISHRGSNTECGQTTSIKKRHRLFHKSNTRLGILNKYNLCNTISNLKGLERKNKTKTLMQNGAYLRKNKNLKRDLIDRNKIGIDRSKRDLEDKNNNSAAASLRQGQAGRELYNKLVQFINSYLNMSKDDGNFTYSVPWVVEWKCPELIADLYGDIDEIDDGSLYCKTSWDEYSCWPRTPAGTYAIIPCPGYLPGIDDSDNATKYCHENGTWATIADYKHCLAEDTEVVNEEDINARTVRFIYNIGFSISTLTLVIALFIFLYFRSLRCLRNSIHCNLIVSFIFMNVMWIIMRHSLIPIRDSPHLWLIKVEVALFNYSQGTNFFWMFVEGLYLHIIIVWTYSADKIKLRYLFVIGWILPAIFILAWIVVMQTKESESSWLPEALGDSGAAYEFIYITPILFVLFANIIFLSTIVWVLITKLRASHTLETRQYRKAVKATVILFPLLGITYVLFIVPPSDHPQVHIVFNYINAVLQSLQGFFVAVFYCFLNGEVKGVLKKRLLRFNDARSLSSKYTKTSVAWTRASRDYTTSASFGNGALLNQARRNNSHNQTPPEHIPLKSKEDYDTEDCIDS